MSHGDFDVVTGPSMVQRQRPLPEPSRPSADGKSELGATPPNTAAPKMTEERRR